MKASPPTRITSRTSNAGFSLTELLVVIAIIFILGSLSVPGLNSVLAGRNSAKALSTLSNVAGLARQRAMGQGTAVALVLSGSSHTTEFLGQAVMLVALAKDGVGTTQMKAITSWIQLPKDVDVESYERNGAVGFYSAGAGGLPGGELPVKLNGGTVSGDYSYVIFRPDGSVDANGNGPALTFQRRNQANAGTDYMLLIQEGSGRTKVVTD